MTVFSILPTLLAAVSASATSAEVTATNLTAVSGALES